MPKFCLGWSEPEKPNEYIPHDHVICETLFGQFVITWKPWFKDCTVFYVDECPIPMIQHACGFDDLDGAKKYCEDEYFKALDIEIKRF